MIESIQYLPEAARKRPREEEIGVLGFNEHRNKRVHTLPLRTSPTGHPKRCTQPPIFPNELNGPISPSPVGSSSEAFQQLSMTSTTPVSPSPSMEVDAAMALEDHSPDQYLYPSSEHRNPGFSDATGRIPTPLHGTFAAQARGNQWEASSSTMQQANAFQTSHDPSVPRSLEGGPAWTMVQNRRLPSPISENGGEDMAMSPGMVLDSSPSIIQQSQLPHPNIGFVPDANMMDMDMASPPPMEQDPGSPSSAPATPSPRSKFGHSRSKHTLNNWTLQPGMKKSFSIGYRSDCEKCRQKIPGHFNHIIVST